MSDGVPLTSKFVLLTDGNKVRLVTTANISILRADGNYTNIWLDDGTHFLITRSLSKIAEHLDNCMFFRANRSCIINLGAVSHIRLYGKNLVVALKNNNDEILVSRQQVRILKGLKL